MGLFSDAFDLSGSNGGAGSILNPGGSWDWSGSTSAPGSILNPSGSFDFGTYSSDPSWSQRIAGWGSTAVDFANAGAGLIGNLSQAVAGIRNAFSNSNPDQIVSESDRNAAVPQPSGLAGIPTWVVIAGAVVAGLVVLRLVK